MDTSPLLPFPTLPLLGQLPKLESVMPLVFKTFLPEMLG